MEEKKKRVRPTVAQVKTLVEECKKMQSEVEEGLGREARLMEKISVLEKSNVLIGEEMERLRAANKHLSEINIQLSEELQSVKSRGFFARVFNLS